VEILGDSRTIVSDGNPDFPQVFRQITFSLVVHPGYLLHFHASTNVTAFP